MAATIYEKSTRALLRDMLTAFDLKPGQVFTAQSALKWFDDNYPKLRRTTVNAHLVQASTNNKNRLHHPSTNASDDLLFRVDRGVFRLYDPATDPAPIHERVAGEVARQTEVIARGEDGGDDGEAEDDDDVDAEPGGAGRAPGARSAGDTEFLLERDLQLYLAKHLDRIEPGLKLFDDEGAIGLEFSAGGGRRIDILAIDSAGGLVVIELKVSRGYEKVVGQLLRYRNWVKLNIAENGQRVRGIIICRKMSDDLRLACADLPDVELYEYQMSVSVARVAAMDLDAEEGAQA